MFKKNALAVLFNPYQNQGASLSSDVVFHFMQQWQMWTQTLEERSVWKRQLMAGLWEQSTSCEPQPKSQEKVDFKAEEQRVVHL